MAARRIDTLLFLAVLGFVGAFFLVLVPALFLGAGGDGWNSPVQASLAAPVLVAMLAISWCERGSDRGRHLARIVVVAAVLLDLHAIVSTTREMGRMEELVRVERWVVGWWLAGWLAWQLAAVLHLLAIERRRRKQ